MLAKATAVMLGTVALAGAYLLHEGAVRIAVDQEAGDGRREEHVHLLVPGALVSAGIHFVPEARLRQAAAQIRPWLPAIRAASRELARLPDADLLEVQDAREHVRVTKRANLFAIDVTSARENVHVSFPLKLADEVAQRLESAGPES
jgi:hypothetical protein